MDKRNRLKINTPETTFNFATEDSMMVPQKISEIEFPEEDQAQPEIFKMYKLEKICEFLKTHFIEAILVLIILFLISKPSGYADLLEEISNLRRDNLLLKQKRVFRNICKVSDGVEVSVPSPLYRYGFLRRMATNPSAILDSSSDCLSIEGSRGEIVIDLKFKRNINKIGIYHPKHGSPRSAINEFVVETDQKRFNFKYDGTGFQDFEMNDISEKIRLVIKNNHGETKYTSLYRFFIFAE